MGGALLVRGASPFARNFTLFLRRHGGESATLLALPGDRPTLYGFIHSITLGVAPLQASPEHDQGRTPWFGRGILDGSRFRFVGWSVGRTIRCVLIIHPGRPGILLEVIRLHARFLRHFSYRWADYQRTCHKHDRQDSRGGPQMPEKCVDTRRRVESAACLGMIHYTQLYT
jgi:hypothetical protein